MRSELATRVHAITTFPAYLVYIYPPATLLEIMTGNAAIGAAFALDAFALDRLLVMHKDGFVVDVRRVLRLAFEQDSLREHLTLRCQVQQRSRMNGENHVKQIHRHKNAKGRASCQEIRGRTQAT